MAITKLNSLAIPAGTVEPADISYPLTNFSSTGIDDNASSNAITIDSSGNIGIGNTTPGFALHIKDTANSNSMRRITIESDSNAGANAGYRFVLNSANSTVRGGGVYFVPGDTDATTYIGLSSTDSDYALVATRENNIGIGTSAPSSLLHLRHSESAILTLEADTDNVTEADIAAIKMSQDGGISTAYVGMSTGNHLVIGANSTTAPSIYFNTAGTGTSYLDGSTGTKMIIHNSGEVTKPSNPAFLARHSSGTATGKIPYNNEVYDVNSDFDTTNNRFTAPVAGYYFFYFHTLTTYAYNGDTRCVFRKNGVQYTGNRHITNKTNWDTSHATALIYCAANDYVEAWFDGLPTSGASYSDSNYNGFFGFLVS